MEKKSLVKNAADFEQVKSAGKRENFDRKKELDDLRAILSIKEGRRFLWRLLTHCKVFESIWRQSAEIHYLSGKQDTGHFLMSEITEAGEELFFTMMREAKELDNN